MTSTPYHRTDLSFLKSVDDLDAEILRLKGRIEVQEEVLKNRVKKVPVETLKLVVPGFIATRVSMKTWGLLSSALGLLFASRKNKDEKHRAKKHLWSSVKQLGIYTGIGVAFKKWKDKQEAKKETLKGNL